jgi:hypothetical protein
VLAELAGLIADGHLEVPIANVYPLTQVRQAYTELERRHTHGKIVLRPDPTRTSPSDKPFPARCSAGARGEAVPSIFVTASPA